jgi:hypothetical protein
MPTSAIFGSPISAPLMSASGLPRVARAGEDSTSSAVVTMVGSTSQARSWELRGGGAVVWPFSSPQIRGRDDPAVRRLPAPRVGRPGQDDVPCEPITSRAAASGRTAARRPGSRLNRGQARVQTRPLSPWRDPSPSGCSWTGFCTRSRGRGTGRRRWPNTRRVGVAYDLPVRGQTIGSWCRRSVAMCGDRVWDRAASGAVQYTKAVDFGTDGPPSARRLRPAVRRTCRGRGSPTNGC